MAITKETTLSLTLRPKAFEEVIGLEKPVRIIKAKLDKGEIPRAILIRGPYGCGKTTLGHIIAQYVQLMANPFFEGVADVHEVNGANERKIENMRALAEEAGSYPMVGTYHVIIIDECHKLTGDAQDILLKELEVPVSPTIWILCTTEPEALNEGVVARCFPLDVEGMDAAQIHELLARAAAAKNYTDDLTAFEAAVIRARIASPRKILQAFEQLLSGNDVDAAVNSQTLLITPEYRDIAFGVCFGSWDKDVLAWGKVPVKPVGQLLLDLEIKLSKKAKNEAEKEEDDHSVDDSEISADGKVQAAHALKAILGGYLKGRVLPKLLKKGTYKFNSPDERDRADKAMQVLAGMIPANVFELQWSGIVMTLHRVNRIMQGK